MSVRSTCSPLFAVADGMGGAQAGEVASGLAVEVLEVGLPYDLPAGLELYSENYESGVAAASLPAHQRSVVTNHKLRSLDDANDLVRQLETGELGS